MQLTVDQALTVQITCRERRSAIQFQLEHDGYSKEMIKTYERVIQLLEEVDKMLILALREAGK